MTEKQVHFKNMIEVTEFSKIASTLSEDVYITGDGNQVNAKSLLGIFGMDISKPLYVSICGSSAGEKRACAVLRDYLS